MTFQYNIKAIPTTYAGVNFRSRLEARWAAFFDLCGWEWDYEPFDLEGWAPDFLLSFGNGNVLAEVKPVDLNELTRAAFAGGDTLIDMSEYAKATDYASRYAVLCLGLAPIDLFPPAPVGVIPSSLPEGVSARQLEGMMDCLTVSRGVRRGSGEIITSEQAWRLAGSMTQWSHSSAHESPRYEEPAINIRYLLRRAAERAAKERSAE